MKVEEEINTRIEEWLKVRPTSAVDEFRKMRVDDDPAT